jgi:hypothetical protein
MNEFVSKIAKPGLLGMQPPANRSVGVDIYWTIYILQDKRGDNLSLRCAAMDPGPRWAVAVSGARLSHESVGAWKILLGFQCN